MGAHSVRSRRRADTARTVRRVAGTSVLSAAAVSSLVGGAGFAQAQEVTASSGSTTVDVETPEVTVPSVPPVSVQTPTTCDIILGSGLASTFPASSATQRCTTQDTTRYTQADTAAADDTTDETSGGSTGTSTGSATPASTAPTSTAPASTAPAESSEPAESGEPAASSESASPAPESSSTPPASGSSTQRVDEPAAPGETKSVPIR